MSTRSAIIIKETVNGKSRFTGIYCHSDGYPSFNGRLLRDHYTGNLAKVRELLALGDISSLGEMVAPPPGVKHGVTSIGRHGRGSAYLLVVSLPKMQRWPCDEVMPLR